VLKISISKGGLPMAKLYKITTILTTFIEADSPELATDKFYNNMIINDNVCIDTEFKEFSTLEA
jgi:hypothetical protein